MNFEVRSYRKVPQSVKIARRALHNMRRSQTCIHLHMHYGRRFAFHFIQSWFVRDLVCLWTTIVNVATLDKNDNLLLLRLVNFFGTATNKFNKNRFYLIFRNLRPLIACCFFFIIFSYFKFLENVKISCGN